MKEVTTRQKYKCDFCKRRSTKGAMERHEKICFRNPNRFCDNCKNKGYTHEVYGDLVDDGDGGLSEDIPCFFCSKRDPAIEKGIAEYEAKIAPKTILKEEVEMPF